MNEGFQALSEREKETLRLLLCGHDAKSVARELGLSVHTINERLRAARRKLGVSSSREAARLLGEAERAIPNSLGDNNLGVAGTGTGMDRKRQGAGHSLAWLAGGMLIMSLIIAAAVLSFALQGGSAADPQAAELQAAAAPNGEARSSAEDSAREWVALTDDGRWTESWRAAGTIFQSQVTADQWASAAGMVREPLGAVSSRVVQNVTMSGSLPGQPAGDYAVIEFQTNFAARNATETVVMVRESGGWKVVGYFIR